MIEKFKFEEIFLKFLWTGLEAIAALSEKEEPKEFSMIDSAQLRTLKKLGLFSSWVLNQGTEEELKWVPNKFCAEIKENKDMIKMSCLDLARKLCETYFKVTILPYNIIISLLISSNLSYLYKAHIYP